MVLILELLGTSSIITANSVCSTGAAAAASPPAAPGAAATATGAAKAAAETPSFSER